jgi:hypothetical protein
MSWTDTADRTLKTAIQTFKTPGTYVRASAPSSPIALDGVFSRQNQLVNPQTLGVGVDSNRPTYGIRRADLPAAPNEGDEVIVSAVTYQVIQVIEDGEGGIELVLNKVG